MSSSDRVPVYFFQTKVNSKETIFPTLLLLWNVPNFLPCICIHSPVSEFVLRGADLMLPGVSRDAHRYYIRNKEFNNINCVNLNDIKVNTVLSIKVIGNPLPCAIGWSILNAKDITASDNKKGRFMKMVHIFRDELWDFTGKIKPNPGFLSNIIKPIEQQNKNNINNDNNEESKNNDETQQGNEDEKKKEITFEEKFGSLSMDNKLIYGFLSTLLSISSSCLPVIVRDIYQQMRQNRNIPQFKDIDVKQSSFNKLGRFAQSKQLESFIQSKQQKSKVFIEAVNAKAITKHLLLILNKIENDKFDRIIKWFEENWPSLQSDNDDENENENDQQPEDQKDNEVIIDMEPNENENTQTGNEEHETTEVPSQDNNQEAKPQTLTNEQRFGQWYTTEFKSSEETSMINETNIIDTLFGGWSNILECNDINEAFINQLSKRFNVILSGDSSTSDSTLTIDTQNPDHVWRSQVLQTLLASIDPDQLPVSASSMLTKKKLYILKPNFVFSKKNLLRVNLEQDIITSVKQTRWKKSAKFLKELTKQNIIGLKDYGNTGGELMITDINYHYLTNSFNHGGKLSFFTPEAFEKFCKKVNELQQKDTQSETKQNDDNGAESSQFMSPDKNKKVKIQTMYRANHRLLPIFGADNISELHSKNKARTFLWSYVEHHNLVSSNKQNIVIDESLFHMLYDSKMFHNKISKDGFRNKKEKEKLQAIGISSQVHRKDLVNLFDEYMQPYTAVILDDDEPPKFKPGFPPKIEIAADKRQGNKFMTHVTGLETYGINPSEFSVTAKRFFAAAVTISSLHGKKAKMKGGKAKQKVSIQGNMVRDVSKKDVPTLLMTHYGIPNQFINAKTNITKQARK